MGCLSRYVGARGTAAEAALLAATRCKAAGEPSVTPLLREASLSDLEILAHLHAVCFESPWGIDAFRKFLQSERAFALLAGEESNFAAFILVQVAADECEILSLATLPSARRRGLARSLVLSAAERAAQSGARKFFLEVAADNETALALYAALGFSP